MSEPLPGTHHTKFLRTNYPPSAVWGYQCVKLLSATYINKIKSLKPCKKSPEATMFITPDSTHALAGTNNILMI